MALNSSPKKLEAHQSWSSKNTPLCVFHQLQVCSGLRLTYDLPVTNGSIPCKVLTEEDEQDTLK